MTRRLFATVIALGLAVSACTYESAGTTTTTFVDPADIAPPTGPADIVFRDQMTDGAGVVVESVTLPAPGFVVLYADEGGAPGEAIGATQIIPAGVIANVPVSFFVPIEADTVVYAQVHVDIDRDEAFTYEPPDAFIDLPGTLANGEVAAAEATINLLAPISPAEVTFAEQRTTGEVIQVLSVTLPAPGFVVIREDDFGEAGRHIGTSGLLPAGTTENVEVTLTRAITISAVLYASAYIDRDGDGELVLGSGEVDHIAQGPDGAAATVGAAITVVPLSPTELAASDQESEGADVVAVATVPAPGFLVLRADDGGAPGRVLAVSDLLALGSTDVTLTLDPVIEEDTTFWLTVYIDFNGDGEFDESDPVGLTGEGEPAETSILVTLPVPEEPPAGS